MAALRLFEEVKILTLFHEIKVEGGSYWIPLPVWNSLTSEERRTLEEDQKKTEGG